MPKPFNVRRASCPQARLSRLRHDFQLSSTRLWGAAWPTHHRGGSSLIELNLRPRQKLCSLLDIAA